MPSVSELLAALEQLSLNDQRLVAASLNARIEAAEKLQPASDGQTEQYHGSYVLEYVRCGKSNCKCARGDLHGPYWYLHRRVGDRVVRRYIGKTRPPS